MELVDTDVLIDVQRGHPPAVEWFGGLQAFPVISGFVVMELIQDARNKQEVERARKLVAPFRIVWPSDSDCARALADFEAFNLSAGLGLLDSLIAATAIGLAATLYTFNGKHFKAVPGLAIAQPFVR